MAETKYKFNRTYEIVLGDPVSGKGLRLVGNEAENEGLHISFRIKKKISNRESSNESELVISNLSNSNLNFIKTRTETVVVKLGWAGDNKVVFIGNISEIIEEDDPSSTEKRTTIRATPAITTVYDPNISRTFPAGSSARTIIQWLIGQNSQLVRASFNSETVDTTYPYGKAVEGTVKQILDEMSGELGFYYRIDNNRLYVSDQKAYQSPNSVARAFEVSPATGLVGIPVYASSDGKRITRKNKKNIQKDGIKFTSLINPLYQAGQAIVIKDAPLAGTYRINACEFSGDWSSAQWYVTCWCSAI